MRGVWALAACAVFSTAARADERVLTFATLAPEGTAWMRLGHEWAEAIRAHSRGQMRVKIISGGAAGDEREAVRKIRSGQLAGAAVTTVGLGVIQGDLLVLQQPMFLRSYEELDFVRTQLAAEIQRKFLERGFVLLAWADVGEVHIFSKFPIRARADLAHARVWTWVDDPVGRKLLQELGVRAVPLGVPDVLPSLENGLIDVCYGSPLAALALQWHSHVRYMTSETILQAVGAIVIARRELELLPADLQQIVLADSKALEDKMIPLIRDDNARALAVLKRNGLRVIDPSPELLREFQATADRIRDPLDGSVIGHEFRAHVEELLAQFRARKRMN